MSFINTMMLLQRQMHNDNVKINTMMNRILAVALALFNVIVLKVRGMLKTGLVKISNILQL